jgi:hypothetical protein
VVVAIVAGLVAAAFGHPLVSLLAAIPWRPRALLMAVALAALWGGMRVAALSTGRWCLARSMVSWS